MSHVRFAQPGDIPALIELGREMHVNSRYAWMRFDASKLWKTLEVAIQDKGQCVMVAGESIEPGEEVLAVLWGRVTSPDFVDEFITEINYLYVRPRKRGGPAAMKMLTGARAWAKNRQCCALRMLFVQDVESGRGVNFAERLGFSREATRFEIRLNR